VVLCRGTLELRMEVCEEVAGASLTFKRGVNDERALGLGAGTCIQYLFVQPTSKAQTKTTGGYSGRLEIEEKYWSTVAEPRLPWIKF